jgi:hypothetical protein
VALDVHAQDRRRFTLRFVRSVGQLDATSLATAPGLYLSLDDDGATQLGSGGPRLLAGGDDATGQYRDAVSTEEILGLVFVQIHAINPIQPRLISS